MRWLALLVLALLLPFEGQGTPAFTGGGGSTELYFIAHFAVNIPDMSDADGGDECLSAIGDTKRVDANCSSMGTSTHELVYPFDTEIYIRDCWVYAYGNGGSNWDSGDLVKLQHRGYDIDATTMNDIASEFTIMSAQDSCGVTPNCIDDETVGVWSVRTSLALDADDPGIWQVEISDTVDTGTADACKIALACEYRVGASG